MAAPSYTEDLTDVTLAESLTGWSAYGGGASGLALNPDSSMQGTNGIGKSISAADKGQYFDNGSGITLPANAHVYVWLFCTTPGLTATVASKGTSILIGTTSANYCQYHVDGNDTYGAAGRVGKCYPINYAVRTTNGSSPYRTATGTPGANPQIFGGGLNTTASAKGENCVIDAIRYGTGAYLTAGELIAAGDGSDNPCTFAGFQAQNDAIANRWGILTLVAGSYELQGTFAIGRNNAGTATLCRFRDSDRNIVVANTIHTASTFNQFIIDHASTRCEWTNISITALGTTAPCQINVNANNPTFIVNGGTWTGIGTITFQSNTTVSDTTIRQTGQVTQNGATISGVVFDRNTASAALVANDMSVVTNNTFISDGTGYAVDLGTISSSASISWSHIATGYAATNGSTGNEVILVNVASGQTLTINVAAGATTPTYHNTGAGSVNVISGAVTVRVRCVTTTGTPIQNVRVRLTKTVGGAVVLSGLTNASGIIEDAAYVYSSDEAVEGWARKSTSSPLYQQAILTGTITSTGLIITAVMISDE